MKGASVFKIKCYFWNPNGTNDIEIINEFNEVVDSRQEALYGINLDQNSKVISISRALKNIASSPISDGIDTVRFLKQYF